MSVHSFATEELLGAIADSFAAEREALAEQLSGSGRPVRVLVDCPMADYFFRPWQDAAADDKREFVFAPTQPDTGPIAQSLESALTPAFD